MAVATGFGVYPVTAAMASRVSVELTVIALPRVYTGELVPTFVPVVPLLMV